MQRCSRLLPGSINVSHLDLDAQREWTDGAGSHSFTGWLNHFTWCNSRATLTSLCRLHVAVFGLMLTLLKRCSDCSSEKMDLSATLWSEHKKSISHIISTLCFPLPLFFFPQETRNMRSGREFPSLSTTVLYSLKSLFQLWVLNSSRLCWLYLTALTMCTFLLYKYYQNPGSGLK